MEGVCQARFGTPPSGPLAWVVPEKMKLTSRRYDALVTGMKRATVYLDEDLHKALKLKAIETDLSLSDIVNQAVRYTLEEDLDDLSEIESRKKEGTMPYETFLKELKSRGQI